MNSTSGGARGALPSPACPGELVAAIAAARGIVVVAGAGISVACGIPDFRSADGLYNSAACAEAGLPSAELLFDLEYFLLDPAPFFRCAKILLPKDVTPSATHAFVAQLQRRGALLRMYTQNVDQLERRAGVTRLVECHGSMRSFRCTGCRFACALEEVRKSIEEGVVALCPACGQVLKPGITFFGEGLPREFDKCWQQDKKKVDLVIVMGTSLKVGSMMKILETVPPHVPLILMNRESVSLPRGAVAEKFDLELLGACDDVSRFLMQELGWATEEASSARSALPRIAAIAPRRFQFISAATDTPTTKSAGEAESKTDQQDQRKRARHAAPQPQYHCHMCKATLAPTSSRSSFFECTQCIDKYLLCPPCYSRGRNVHATEHAHKFVRRQPHSDFIQFT